MTKSDLKSVLPIKKYISTGILFLCFLLFTIAVLVFDVKPIGPKGSAVGFASLNESFNKINGSSSVWYEISDYLGYAALGIALGFALFGLWQLIKRRSFKKVDGEIWLLAALYADLAICYILFEFLKVNYRPVLEDGELAASYPSSHCMLAVVIFGSAIYMLRNYIGNKTVCNIAVIVVILMLAVTIAGRVLAGVHWLTDIIGGLLLGSALLSLFFAAIETYNIIKTARSKRK